MGTREDHSRSFFLGGGDSGWVVWDSRLGGFLQSGQRKTRKERERDKEWLSRILVDFFFSLRGTAGHFFFFFRGEEISPPTLFFFSSTYLHAKESGRDSKSGEWEGKK